MAKPFFAPLVVASAATGNGTAYDVAHAQAASVAVFVGGTFVGTYQVKVSHDGTNFVQYGSNLTAPGVVEIKIPVKMVRVDCSAYTSGQGVASVGGTVG
jgi:hypothetical protein